MYDTPMGIPEPIFDQPGRGDDTATTNDLVRRLRRIEGQVRGLQQMLNDQRECSDVLTQLTAARKALDQVGFLLVANRLSSCIAQPGTDVDEASLDEVKRMFLRLA